MTGAAHCLLGPWWEARLGSSFVARQVSSRGGTLRVRVGGGRVRLAGGVVTVFSGSLLVS